MKYIVEALLNPFFIALFLLILVFIYFCTLKDLFLIKAGLGFSVLILIMFSTAWLPEHLTQYLEKRYSPVYSTQKNIKFVVVLSGGQSDTLHLPANMQLYGASQKRLWEGLRVLKQLPEARLVLSGGTYNRNQASEAANLAVLSTLCLGDKSQMILEEQSMNTAGQAENLKKIVQKNPFYLVTSAIHMPRAMAAMQTAGLHPIAAPADFTHFWNDEHWTKKWIPNPYNLVYSSIVLHELLGRAYYQFMSFCYTK